MPTEGTIAAICTAIAAGQGGVAIIRISGPDAQEVGTHIVSTPKDKNWESHQIIYGHVLSTEKHERIDEVLVFLMRGPRSFTGEDVVEIHCHGGIIAVQRVLELVLAHKKARRALPGEFTQRALLNGKLDLTQAESINALIAARSRKAAQLAMAGIDGGIQQRINLLREQLLDQLSELEARVDFEDELPPLDDKKLLNEIFKVQHSLLALVNDSNNASLIHQGLNIAIIGCPNVGKRSLLNRLSKRERAIVTGSPGTTRDLLESEIILEGVPIKLIDTAGIRKTNNEVEQLGIKKSQTALITADIVILVFDISLGWRSEDKQILSQIPKNTEYLIVGNKSDCIEKENKIYNQKLSSKQKIDIIFSAKSGEGEEILIKKILEKFGASELQNIQLALNERQKDLANTAAQSLENLKEVAKQELPWDFWTIDLRHAIQLLGEITGEEITENVLDRIFSRFCIGK